jgi:Holliday junction resolvase-like predicted endonuclease
MARTRAKIEQLEQSNIELKFTVNLTYEKEKELKQVERDLKMKVKELQLSTDKAEAKSSSLERELNRLLRQENEEDQSNGNTSSSNANRWEKNACQEIKRRDQLIHSLKIQNTELAIQAEKDRRKSDLNLTEQQNLQKCIQRERINTKNELEILQTELADAITKVKAEHQQKVEIMNEKCALQQEITSLQESFSINKGELERLHEEDKRKSQEFIELRIRLQTKIDESNEALQKETSKMIDEKESMLLERDEMMNKNDNRLDSVQTKIDQLELSLKESMVLNQNLRKQIQSQTNNYTHQQKDLESMFQSKMVECQESFDDQVKKNYEVMSTLRRVSEQKLDLDVILKKCNQQIYQSERKLIVAEEKVSLLSKQLHDNLCDQSDKISQIKALKMELRQLKAMKVQE